MGKRGPQRTPTPILKARGSPLAKREAKEPLPPAGRPPCPAWLSPEARKAWRSLAPILGRMGVLTLADGQALARYCETFARWRKLSEDLRQEGEIFVGTSKAGAEYEQIKAASCLVGQLADQLLRLEREFGLTPAARSRIEVEHHEAQKPEEAAKDKRRFLVVG